MTKFFSKDELKCLLQQGVATVTFTKVDGTERIMNCTLKTNIIPSVPSVVSEQTEEKKSKIENPNVLAVWDIDVKGWRSFKIDSIKNWVLSTE